MDMERQNVIAAAALPEQKKEEQVKKASFFSSLKAVARSFIGLRRRKGYESDAASLNPVHVVIAALLCAAVFIGVLIMAVRYAVSGH